MAGPTTETVFNIFRSMESGPAAPSSAATAQAWLDHHSRSLGFFIDGKFVHLAERRSLSVLDSKGGQVCGVLCAEEADVSQCAASAVSGFKSWSLLSCYQRAKVLLRLVGVLGLHAQCLSELAQRCVTACSPPSLIRLLQFYSSWAQLRDTLLSGWTPLGVVAVVTSDDSSVYSLMLKVLPALAMGNAVIVVPGRSVAPPALLLAQLFSGAGLPAGVLNVLTGSDVTLGVKVAQNPSICYVTYSGSKPDGLALVQASAGMGVPVSVSPCVGATCPFIIFESADINSAVDEVIEAAFKKKSEVHWVLCVQESVCDNVVDHLKLRLAGLKCVSLQSEADRSLVDTAVQEAQQQGATLIQPCSAPPSGPLYPPTVLCGAAPASPCVVSPAPGPLLPLMTFRCHKEAVAVGNHSPHGLAASIWTEDLTLALETAKNLSVGSVWVNSHSVVDPCLPVCAHKDGGSCADGGQEGLYQFLRPSVSSPPIRSSAVPLDYSKFGTEVSPAVIPDPASSPPSYLQFVGGKACKSVSGCSVAVQSPGGGGVLGLCPEGGRKDVRNAVEAALKVQPGWQKKTPSARALSLHALAKGVEAKRQDLATSLHTQTGVSMDEAEKEVELSITRLALWAAYCDKVQGGSLVLQSSDLPAGLVNVVTGKRDQLTVALANHSVIRSIWYWGSAEGCRYLQYTCTRPLKTLRLVSQEDQDEGVDWTQASPSFLEDLWRNAVQWKSVWIPTA
uniref:Aldehyde dehydrogenase 16 family, member A1 n=1 Tax=Oryzias latipes TaxID=8090 RepID=A0A3P9JC60_ORYLA